MAIVWNEMNADRKLKNANTYPIKINRNNNNKQLGNKQAFDSLVTVQPSIYPNNTQIINDFPKFVQCSLFVLY